MAEVSRAPPRNANQTFLRSARSSSSINFLTSAGFIFGKSPRKCSSTPGATAIRFQTSTSPGADAMQPRLRSPGQQPQHPRAAIPQFVRSPPGRQCSDPVRRHPFPQEPAHEQRLDEVAESIDALPAGRSGGSMQPKV